MNKKNNFKNLNFQKGITLVEIVVIVFIISIFTVILISNFPKMLRQLALSRATYNLGQNLRRVQDLGLSGIKLLDANEDQNKSIPVKGYGIYFSLNEEPKKYIIYADVADSNGDFNQKYDGGFETDLCSKVDQDSLPGKKLTEDCIIEIIDIGKENPELFIDYLMAERNDANDDRPILLSINFSPPRPDTVIINEFGVDYRNAWLCLGNSDGAKRCIYVNSSGLIDIQ